MSEEENPKEELKEKTTEDKVKQVCKDLGWKYEGENLVKKTCRELSLTYKQLGEEIGYGENSVSNASRGEVSKTMMKAIELYVKNLNLTRELEDSEKIKLALKSWLQ
jgi:hypothetical protein